MLNVEAVRQPQAVWAERAGQGDAVDGDLGLRGRRAVGLGDYSRRRLRAYLSRL